MNSRSPIFAVLRIRRRFSQRLRQFAIKAQCARTVSHASSSALPPSLWYFAAAPRPLMVYQTCQKYRASAASNAPGASRSGKFLARTKSRLRST